MASCRVLGNTRVEASEKAGPPIMSGHGFVGILLGGELSEVFFMFNGTGIHIWPVELHLHCYELIIIADVVKLQERIPQRLLYEKASTRVRRYS